MVAVKRQLASMGCKRYEVGIRENKTGKMQIREWTKEQLFKSIPFLKRANAQNNDIYIRPHKDEPHGLVLIDDIDEVTIEEMRENGHNPCLTIETSPKNYQAWVHLGKGVSSSIRGEIGRYFSHEYNADPNSSDHRHFGRLSGFTNRKEEHMNPYSGGYPYCLCRYSGNEAAVKSKELILKGEFETQKKALERSPEKIRGLRFIPRHRREDVTENYRRQVKVLTNRYGNPNKSYMDWMIAKTLFHQGYDRKEIEIGMREGSPSIEDRKKGHVEDYIRRTLDEIEKLPEMNRSKEVETEMDV